MTHFRCNPGRICFALVFALSFVLIGLATQSQALSYTLTPFAISGASNVYPYGISNNGTIVGKADFTAFLESGGSTTSLGQGSWFMSEAYGISPNGKNVVGFCFSVTGTGSFAYSNSVLIDASSPAAWQNQLVPSPGAMGVNDAGTIVAYGLISGTSSDSVKIEGGVMTTLSYSGWSDIIAYGINNSGAIVGSGTYNGVTQAFLATGSTIVPLAVPAGITQAAATAINSVGQIVGWGFDGSGNQQSFICDGTTCSVIESPGWSFLHVWGINDAGTIVGWGQDSVGTEMAFTGTSPTSTVPVPAPYMLLSTGLALFAALRWRRKR
jgi:uncharacterized membrane protein